MTISAEARACALDLIDFIDASPSPWHAAATIEQRLSAGGFQRLIETEKWPLQPNGRYFVVRGGGSVIAFVQGRHALDESGLRIVGAHTDSPGLRLKPKAAHGVDQMLRLGVEIYGSPILASFLDRDLSLAGRVNVRTKAGPESRLLRFQNPLVRLPNLAIHMNRAVNEEGLKLHKQLELNLLMAVIQEGEDADVRFRECLSDRLHVNADDILTWELNVFDTQPGCLWGPDLEFIADSQLDNLASCHAALSALQSVVDSEATCMCAFFDHEEVGSESASGAAGSFVDDVIARIAASSGMNDEARRCALAGSFFVSADMAHAYQPNFPNAYEPWHRAIVNAGPVIKTNVNQRYTTSADTAALFVSLCESVGVRYQHYTHRTDLACGSTIGPIVASRLGIASVDVGSPMWAMHSVRESAGVADHSSMITVLRALFHD
jgi:aspartyl aminopeptidase